MQTTPNKLTVEVWSDVMCPFCYIGKRRFEEALADFPEAGSVELIWKSFQLQPELTTDPRVDLQEHLSREKGMPLEQVRQMTAQIVEMGRPHGLAFDFANAVVANSFDAHRLLHYARTQGKQNALKEALFRAQFVDGRNVDDYPTLLELGESAGLDRAALNKVLESDAHAEEVAADIAEARELGVRGVPFFVFDRKYAVSGAQETALFGQALRQAFDEWRARQPQAGLQVTEGPSCSVDGNCD